MRIMHIALGGCLSAAPIRYGLTEDTGGHIAYILGATSRQAERQDVESVEIVTRAFEDGKLGPAFSKEVEPICSKRRIVRIWSDRRDYLEKEDLVAEIPSLTRSFLSSLEARERPDVIHAHFSDAAILAHAAREAFGIPWVLSSHSLGLDKGGKGPAFAARLEQERRAIRDADALIASSRDEAERQIGGYSLAAAGRTHRISPGTSVETVGSLRKARKLIAPFLRDMRKPIVLAIARPVRKKNLDGLLRAFAMSRDLRQKANLVIVAGHRQRIGGTNSETDRVASDLFDLVDRHDLWGQVALPRTHDQSDIAGLYALAAKNGVFVNPAKCEPFGLTVVEALKCGAPVVATCHGGPGEIIETTGFGACIDPSDERAIAAACLAMIDDPERASRQRAAARKASVAYSWTAWADRTNAVYTALRSSAPSRPAPRRILFSDMDATLTGDRDGIADLLQTLHRERIELVVATGRSISEARRVLSQWDIPEPAILISSVGSEIWHKREGAAYQIDRSFQRDIDRAWYREAVLAAVDRLGVPFQNGFEQRAHKVSCVGSEEDSARIAALLSRAGIDANVIPSHGRMIDILPKAAGKAAAARFVARALGLSPADCLAAGDSGNDRDLLTEMPVALLPSNALPEIDDISGAHVFRSPHRHAAGIVDSLRAYLDAEAQPTLLAAE